MQNADQIIENIKNIPAGQPVQRPAVGFKLMAATTARFCGDLSVL
jgi:hypothetical protein